MPGSGCRPDRRRPPHLDTGRCGRERPGDGAASVMPYPVLGGEPVVEEETFRLGDIGLPVAT